VLLADSPFSLLLGFLHGELSDPSHEAVSPKINVRKEPSKGSIGNDHEGNDKNGPQNDAGAKVVQKIRHETGENVTDQPPAADLPSSVQDFLRQIKTQKSCKGEKEAKGCADAFGKGGKRETPEGNNGQSAKNRHKPQGGKAEGVKNPSCKVGAHRAKEIEDPLRMVRLDSKDRIRRVKGEQAHPQDDRQKQEHNAPNLFPQ
jgi:hypothetical protein